MNILHGFGGQLLLGALATLQLAAAALLLGTLFGAAVCGLQLSGHRILRAAGNGYAAVVRGIPDLLIVFAVFFGGSLTLAALTGRYVEIDTFLAGVAALALSFGAYVAEIARGALLAVPKTQREAARTLGLSRAQALWTVVLPQAAASPSPRSATSRSFCSSRPRSSPSSGATNSCARPRRPPARRASRSRCTSPPPASILR